MTTVNNFLKLGDEIEHEIQDGVRRFVELVWEEVVLSPNAPYWSGSLLANYKVIPYIGSTGSGGVAGATFKKPIVQVPGHYPKRVDKLDLSKYRNQWSNFVLFNSVPYLDEINDTPNKPYTNWIELGYKRAVNTYSWTYL